MKTSPMESIGKQVAHITGQQKVYKDDGYTKGFGVGGLVVNANARPKLTITVRLSMYGVLGGPW